MKKLDSRLAVAIAALSLGLLHCSADPSPTQGDVPSGGAAAMGVAGGGVAGISGTGPASPGGGGGGVNAAGQAGMGGGETSPAGSGGSLGATAGTGGADAGSAGTGGADAGSAGTGGVDAGAGNGACGSNALVCEDFEQYAVANAPAGGWAAALRGEGKIVVDATRAFTGKQSLHVTGKLNKDQANISRPIQTTSPTAYVRFMYYGTSYPASSGVHTRLARLGTADAASGDPNTSYSLATYNGLAIEKVNSIYLRDTGTKLNDPKLLNRWTCLEFAVDMSGGVGKVKTQIWVDGRELKLSQAGSSSHGMTSPSWDPLELKLFILGLEGYQADSQVGDFWIDDIAVTPQRVGCQAMSP